MKRRGVGYSSIYYGTGYGNGFPDESRAKAEIHKNGTFTIYAGAAEVGQGAYNVMWQIAAEALGVNIELITIENSHTELYPDSGTAAASRQTYNTGNAVLSACEKLRESMLYALSLEGEKELEFQGIGIKTAGKLYSFEEIYIKMLENSCDTISEGYFRAFSSQLDENGQGNPYWPYVFATQKAIVEVDDETGKVDVLEIVSCNDSGKIINPDLAEGQVEGGSVMGIGYALMEKVEIENGKIKNLNFSDYIIPTALDAPRIKVNFIECEESSGPYGAKGLGEPAMIPTAPAIINAIYDAVGVRITSLPATCEVILEAIKEKECKSL